MLGSDTPSELVRTGGTDHDGARGSPAGHRCRIRGGDAIHEDRRSVTTDRILDIEEFLYGHGNTVQRSRPLAFGELFASVLRLFDSSFVEHFAEGADRGI